MNWQDITKHDQDFRNFAKHLTKCEEKADDLVQDMYLYIERKDYVTKSYALQKISCLFIDQKRKEKKRTYTDQIPELTDNQENNSIFVSELIEKEIESIPYVNRQMLIENQTKSIREIAKEYNIPYHRVWEMTKRAKEKLKKNKRVIELYNEITGKS